MRGSGDVIGARGNAGGAATERATVAGVDPEEEQSGGASEETSGG